MTDATFSGKIDSIYSGTVRAGDPPVDVPIGHVLLKIPGKSGCGLILLHNVDEHTIAPLKHLLKAKKGVAVTFKAADAVSPHA